jgi:post-segregation antitoxin (ccd killing protein)
MQTNEDIDNESTKQKLTLGIDRKVIEKAKAAGINISAITEQLLKAITYQPNEGNTRNDVVRAYESLLEKAGSLMAEYDGLDPEITVGKVGSRMVFLHSRYGLMFWDDHTKNMIENPSSVDSVLELLYDPMKILEKLIVCLTELAEENKEKLAELKFALRLVKALSDDEGEDKN